jgi:hypothetical protein
MNFPLGSIAGDGMRTFASKAYGAQARMFLNAAASPAPATKRGANPVLGLQHAIGNHEVQRLLRDARRFSSQGTARRLQRRVILGGKEFKDKARFTAFIKARKWRDASQARSILDDMASAGDVFDFQNEQELQFEILKRASTVRHMEESQANFAARGAFAYPFSESNKTELYGPRVNYAARDYWEPAVSDHYADRDTKANRATNAKLKRAARSDRFRFYGDPPPGEYAWTLSGKGQADPYNAVASLFTPQTEPRLRALLHCDFLISLVNMLSLADAVGPAEFNHRVKVFGTEQFVLRWNAFEHLHLLTCFRDPKGECVKVSGVGDLPKLGLATTQRVRPSSPADLIVGDHVVFFNHLAYDLINVGVGNAWRLENAVLIKRGSDPGSDVFLGHGSGRRTAAEMLERLAEEFNRVSSQADALVTQAKSRDKKARTRALIELGKRFPNIHAVGADFRVRGYVAWKFIDEPFDKLRSISAKDVVGPRDPLNPSLMYPVERPFESAK